MTQIQFENLRRFCALTFEPYLEEDGTICYSGVERAHVIPFCLSGTDTQYKLEKMWGMPRYSLEDALQGDLNMIPLRGDWHVAFDSSDWVLLPRLSTLQNIHQSIMTHLDDPVAAAKIYPWSSKDGKHYIAHRYVFVPFGEISKKESLVRRQFVDSTMNTLDPDGTRTFKPSNFDELPEVVSSVHPYAVIFKAVSGFGKHDLRELPFVQHRILMFQAQAIAQLWEAYLKLPDPAPQDPSSPHTGGGDKESLQSEGRRWIRLPHQDNSKASGGGAATQGCNSGEDQQPADTPTEIALSETMVSHVAMYPSETFCAKPLTSAKSDVDIDRPSNLEAYQSPDVIGWRKKSDSGYFDAALEVERLASPPLEGDKPLVGPFVIQEAFASLARYQAESPAPLPRGQWERWCPQFVRNLSFEPQLHAAPCLALRYDIDAMYD